MNMDTDKEPRRKVAYSKLIELVEEKVKYVAPRLPAPSAEAREALSALTPDQAEDVSMHFLFGISRIGHNPFGEQADMGATYDSLASVGKEQVVAFYNALLATHGLILGWYEGHGQEDGRFRFELALHPVASR